MTLALPSGQTLEVMWDGVNWSDESDYVTDVSGSLLMEATFGRKSATGEVEAAEFTCTLDNRDGRFTPDNPLSPYYPNVKRGAQIRWKVTEGDAVTRTEFVGYIQRLDPMFDGDGVEGAKISVTAADRTVLNNRILDDNAVELARAECVANSAGFDAWPLTDKDGATNPANVGDGSDGVIVPPTRTAGALVTEGGSYTFGVPDGGIIASGMVSLAPISTVGHVLELPVSVGTVNDIQFWFRTTEITTGNVTLAEGWSADGARVWEAQLVPSGAQMDLNIKDASGTLLGTTAYGVSDGVWRHLWAEDNGAGAANFYVASADPPTVTGYAALAPAGADIRSTAWLVIGGNMRPVTGRGLQNRCCTIDVAQVMVNGAPGISFGYARSGKPLRSQAVSDRVADFSRVAFGSTGAVTVTGSSTVTSATPDVPGRTVIEVMQEIARTVGGVFWVKPDGTLEFRLPDALWSDDVVLTIDAEADLEGAPRFASGTDTRPTRVNVTSPVGDVTVISPDEGAQVVEDSIDTCALTVNQAQYAGQIRMVGSDKLRVESLAMNLSTAQSEPWADAYAIYPGARVEVGGLPAQIIGWDYQHYWVVGWRKRVEVTTEGATDGMWLELDLEPAQTFARADVALAGSESMTATAGTISGTSTGTLVVTTSSGPTLSTNAGNYPCDFDWNGERVTVASAPAGSSSPQTVTVTVRGVAPSVARTHGSGEPFNVIDPAKAGI